jgi:hypothetical protein
VHPLPIGALGKAIGAQGQAVRGSDRDTELVQTLMTTRKGTAVKEATPYVRTLISEDLPADDAPALRVDLPYGDDYGNKSVPSFPRQRQAVARASGLGLSGIRWHNAPGLGEEKKEARFLVGLR